MKVLRRVASVVALIVVAITAHGETANPGSAASVVSNQALKDEVERLKEENQLRKEQLESSKQLIEAQRALVDEQKLFAASQKGLIDALFPAIEGGRNGNLNFSSKDEIGPLIQPAAIEALNALALRTCTSVKSANKAPAQEPAAREPVSNLLIIGDDDLQLPVQYRIALHQLDGLIKAYQTALPKGPGGTSPQSAIPPGLVLYGTGAVAKQIASVLKLFWSDREVYLAAVHIDERALIDAIAKCVGPHLVKTTQTVLTSFVVSPSTSDLNNKLTALSAYRFTAAKRIGEIEGNSNATTERAALSSLNSQYDAILEALFSTSDQKKYPVIIGLLLGEAVAKAWTDDYKILSTRIIKVSGVGLKKSSNWHADRLYGGASLTISHRLIDKSGVLLTSGTETMPLNLTRVKLD